MKRLLVFVASAILLPCLSAQTGASVDIIRNHKTALSHVFDPATAADAFLIPIDQTGEMPMPTGINETLRKQVDAARTAKIKQKKLENRGIINDKPTPGNTTTPFLKEAPISHRAQAHPTITTSLWATTEKL